MYMCLQSAPKPRWQLKLLVLLLVLLLLIAAACTSCGIRLVVEHCWAVCCVTLCSIVARPKGTYVCSSSSGNSSKMFCYSKTVNCSTCMHCWRVGLAIHS